MKVIKLIDKRFSWVYYITKDGKSDVEMGIKEKKIIVDKLIN